MAELVDNMEHSGVEQEPDLYEEKREVEGGYVDVVSLTHITIDEGALLQRAKDARLVLFFLYITPCN